MALGLHSGASGAGHACASGALDWPNEGLCGRSIPAAVWRAQFSRARRRTFLFLGITISLRACHFKDLGGIRDNGGTGAVTKVGTGTLTLTGACSYTGPTTVSNGELVVSTVFASQGSCLVTPGAAFGVTNFSSGSGAISNLTLAAGSTLELINVSSATTPLLVASNLAVGGSCTVKVTGPNGLAAGGSYPLVSYAGTLSATFTNLQLQMPYGWRGTLANSGNQISLANVAVVSTASPQMSAMISGQQLQLLWPQVNTGWRLLMNTNLAGTNWVTVSGSVGTNQMFIPVNTTNSSVFFRMVYP